MMVRELGIPTAALDGGLDEAYLEALARQVRESSLDAAVLLAQDLPHADDGTPLPEVGGFRVPNSYLFEAVARHPDLFIPAASIHPGRADALDELEECLARGARVLKLLPNCLNVDCSDPRFRPFWKRMAEGGMILLAHTGGEYTLPVLRPEFADPARLRLPLECGVTVIAAHCAGRSGLFDPDYTAGLVELFREFPHCYGDNSALCSLNRARTLRPILRGEVLPRIIHGSDYPVPVMGSGPLLHGRLDWEDYRRCRGIKNLIERDYQLKRAIGFPQETFTRMDALLAETSGP